MGGDYRWMVEEGGTLEGCGFVMPTWGKGFGNCSVGFADRGLGKLQGGFFDGGAHGEEWEISQWRSEIGMAREREDGQGDDGDIL